MKTMIKNINILGISLLLIPTILLAQGQPYFSESWNTYGGETAMFFKNVTTTDDQRNIYIAGATLNQEGNHDILIQKLDSNGELIWEATYNGDANMDDAATDLFIDDNYNVYIVGTAIIDPLYSQDLIVIKYDEDGIFKWKYVFDDSGSQYGIDVGTAITGDNNGSIYATGSSFRTGSQADYITIRLNSESGYMVWEKRYDYLNLNDIPAKIIVKGDYLYVSGASQSSGNKWELATLLYNPSNGTLINTIRSEENGTEGVNEINDITIDNEGNIYLTGTVKNNSYDIATYKLDEELNILWETYHDAYGDNDKGNGIKVDNQGNVYVAGTISTPNEGKNYQLLKYDSSGALLWEREFNGTENGDDEATQLVLHNDNIFITGLAKSSSYYSFQTLVYKPNGDILTQAEYANLNENEKPTGIAADLNGDIIVIGQTELASGNFRGRTIKYSLYEKPFEPVFENGEPKYNANEVIIRFDRSAVNYDAIDRKGFIAGQLDEFVKPNVITEMNNKLGMNVARLPTYKVFRRMTTADTLSISRLGDTVKVDDFWATLSVMFPKNVDEIDVIDDLKTVERTLIHYVHTNRIIEKSSVEPSDEYYFLQKSLFSENFEQNHINVEEAWEIEVGQSYVKVGVFDDPINWRHLDFGDGSYHGSKIKGGWNYEQNSALDAISSSMPNNHGTAVAGIIGALRNNDYPDMPGVGIGVAGIAGGDGADNNTGVDLYSAGIFYRAHFSTIAQASEAIVEGSIVSADTNTKMGFGLHLQNHSWGALENETYSTDSIQLLHDAVSISWRNHSVLIAGRGNSGHGENFKEYPACYQDEMVINVGASGLDGGYKDLDNGDLFSLSSNRWASSYGKTIDLIAPGVTDIIKTTSYVGDPDPDPKAMNYEGCLSFPSYINSRYECFNGTSAAAPHVTGVAALMYSRHNVLSTPAAPNNLTTEDIENILQKTATDITGGPFNYQPGYDQYNGHGRLNAGEAVKQIDYPKYYVKHSDVNITPTITSIQEDVNVELLEEINGMNPGNYIADLYKYEWTYENNVLNPSEEKIIDWWPVWAASYKGVRPDASISGAPFMDTIYTVNVDSTHASVNVVTYVWHITYNSILDQPENKWTSGEADYQDPANLRFMYSIHVKNESLLSIDEEKLEPQVNLYPNPTDETITVDFGHFFTHPNIEIYNLEGQLIKVIEVQPNDSNTTIDVSNFSRGIYMLRISDKEKAITKKFIKK